MPVRLSMKQFSQYGVPTIEFTILTTANVFGDDFVHQQLAAGQCWFVLEMFGNIVCFCHRFPAPLIGLRPIESSAIRGCLQSNPDGGDACNRTLTAGMPAIEP